MKAMTDIRDAILSFGEDIDPIELFPTLLPEASDYVFSDPFAFVLAICLDRGTTADVIWTIPYYLREQLGHLDPKLISEMSEEELKSVYARLPKKPRYINAAPRTIAEIAHLVVTEFGGEATGIWTNKAAREVKATFREVYGVGPGIASMAVLLIERAFGEMFTELDRPQMDIKPDVQTMKVLFRLGVADTQDEYEAVQAARHLNPAFPGALDNALWLIGRKWCHTQDPNCEECPLNAVCPKIGVEGRSM